MIVSMSEVKEAERIAKAQRIARQGSGFQV